ncbi:MAG: lasso peptide biosynthesis B2 protein [Deltaproteobacteria bacterium]|nr:lasso peptide biosynthesis B2 protein [Deltaproteobacteria bacterium]
MSPTATFLKKPLSEKALYLETTFWLGISRIAILILPFRWIAPFLGRHMASSEEDERSGDRQAVATVSRAVRTMSRHLPWECKCLVQAISGKMMLRRRQVSSTLYLGVAKKDDGDLIAHAWLRAGEIILLGGDGLERFGVVSTFA